MSPLLALRELERIARVYAGGLAPRKCELLARLAQARLRSATEVSRFHELACFLRAYPDDAAVLAAARGVLESFGARPDLRRHRRRLADSGIAGTSLHFPFHWVTARWLAAHWPDHLHVDWPAFSQRERERFEHVLPLLLPYAEWPDPELGLSPKQWLERLKGPEETDATFLIRRFAALGLDARERESLFHDLGMPLRLDPAPGSPSRSAAWLAGGEPVFQRGPLSRARPPVARTVRRRLRSVETLSRRDGQSAIELARTSLISRGRDLDGIMYASPDDVRSIDAGGGFGLACLGLAPEHRALVETLYVFLLLENGVPIGYFQAALSFESAEVNYHVFTTFRGGETSEHYVRALGVVHQMFGSNAFAVHPYQLGHENRDALRAGAFWFYRKLGFSPENPRVLAALEREERLARRDPAHRSSPSALRTLASDYVFLYLSRPRDDIAGKLPLSAFSLAVSDRLAARFGSDRERGLRVSARELAELTDTRLGELSRSERLAWERLAPLALALPGVTEWPRRDLQGLAELVRAKGAVREEEFARRLDRHDRVRQALLELAARVRWPAREKVESRR